MLFTEIGREGESMCQGGVVRINSEHMEVKCLWLEDLGRPEDHMTC